MEGTAGIDVLNGTLFDDTINGNGGDDYLSGGRGADTLAGGAGDDQYYVYAADSATFEDVIVELPGGGFDQIRTTLASFSLAGLPEVESLFGIANISFSLTGNDGDNYIIGNNSADTLEGGLGNDKLEGQGGNDIMRGGLGDDEYVVNDIGDVIEENAGEGTDKVWTELASYSLAGTNLENLSAASQIAHDFRGNAAGNVIFGAGGNDIIRLQDGGNDSAYGGLGNDVFLFGATMDGLDEVDGGSGTDQIALQGGVAFTFGTGVVGIESIGLLAGNDTRFGDTAGNFCSYDLTTRDVNVAAGAVLTVDGAKLRAGENLTFNGSAETDGSFFIYGGRGIDALTGGARNDVFLFGSDGHFGAGDAVNGGSGIDQLALRGNYTLTFGAGQLVSIESLGLLSAQDTRYGALGTSYNYNLTMNDGNVAAGVQLFVDGAKLRGGETLVFNGSAETDGSFQIIGGANGDTIAGSQNGDILQGNGGADQLTGGGGADSFRYKLVTDSTASATDHILDFASGTDRIDLTRIDANAGLAGDQAFSWIGSNAFSGAAGELRAYQSGSDWFVEGDTNGDGAADLVIQVSVTGGPLVQADFLP
jgi:Ca2+-binding RTX toxin-like protein